MAAMPVAAAASPFFVETAPIAEPAPPRPEPAPRPEPVAATPRETFNAPPPPPAPPADLDAALRESGLVMIQTKADRVAPVVEAEETAMPRPRRERRPPPPDLNAPLMQVETAHKSDAEAPPQ
jgi:hypothetical protein